VYRICEARAHTCGDKCYAVKIAKEDKSFNPIEIRIQKYVLEKLDRTEARFHFNAIIKELKSHTETVIILRYEKPYKPKIRTVEDLITETNMSERIWKSINFQFIVAFTEVQRRIPGFTHNDAHTSNILVVPNTTNHHCEIVSDAGRRMSLRSKVLIRIIDFGQALTPNPKYQTRDAKKFLEWKSILGNTMYDFHRFAVWSAAMMEAVKTVYGGTLPTYYLNWRKFVLRWIPVQLLPDTDIMKEKSTKKWLQPTNGLIPTSEGWAFFKQYYGPGSRGLSSMLDDPYFDEFEQ